MATEYEIRRWLGDGTVTHRWTDPSGGTLEIDLHINGTVVICVWEDSEVCVMDMPGLRILRDVLTAHIARHTGNEKP